ERPPHSHADPPVRSVLGAPAREGNRRRAAGRGQRLREHRYSFEMPHSARRVWALFQDYDRWPDYAPMVLRVDVRWPGDEHHNGRLRRVIYKLPLGRRGSALELVQDVEPERGYTYTMISSDPGNDQTGRVGLEPLGPNRTRSPSKSATTSRRRRSSGSRGRST